MTIEHAKSLYSCNPIAYGCVLYLPLWALGGPRFKSIDRYGHTCAVAGALEKSNGRLFDGTDDVIDCGSDAILDALTGNMTIEAWINPTSLGEGNSGRIASKGGTISLNMITNTTVQLRLIVSAGNVLATAATNAAPFGSWTHVAGVYNKVNALIYTDLTLVTGTASTGSVDYHAADNFLIGDISTTNRCFVGLIGEVRIYNRALSLVEITHNYNVSRRRYS